LGEKLTYAQGPFSQRLFLESSGIKPPPPPPSLRVMDMKELTEQVLIPCYKTVLETNQDVKRVLKK